MLQELGTEMVSSKSTIVTCGRTRVKATVVTFSSNILQRNFDLSRFQSVLSIITKFIKF